MGPFKRKPRAKVVDIKTGEEKKPDPRTLEDKLDRLIEQLDELREITRKHGPAGGA